MVEKTLSIIKPDAVERNLIGEILSQIEAGGLQVKAMKMVHMSKKQAQGFYAVHKDRPFFDSLTDYMSSGPVVVAVLEGENAIARYREVMGATNPEEAAEGTIRKRFARDIEKNSVHGSDAPETAEQEISYFFSQLEVMIS
ncbi:nucleoside-diphosphate kinase [Desulfovermiculus halophilus]|jgi:nucleoside-diphosphate kinase|uniref:nucleoside-diphosphate kinase n=1 Tax=Desulfovermiculus halophilus TaxID=339722 RepID=UPI0004855A98|nr:nucleoside-diphosphate kinase [Desulfovermiculus halophilus]